MADIVMAYGASHAPMMTADPESAPPAQAENFFGALDTIREQATASGAQAVVMMSGEHFSNFFYDNLPQIVDRHRRRARRPAGEMAAESLKLVVPGEPGLASHLLAETIAAGFQPGALAQDGRRPRLHDGLLQARSADASADGSDRDELHPATPDDVAPRL